MRIRKESRESPSQCLYDAVVIGWPTFQVEEDCGRRPWKKCKSGIGEKTKRVSPCPQLLNVVR